MVHRSHREATDEIPRARTRPRSRGARLLLVLFGILAGLAAVELGLQAISYAVWVSGRRGTAGANPKDKPTILCVGDSFTYGMGAADAVHGSYPARLERILASRGRAVEVVNDGWGAQTSRDVLLRLERALRALRPRLVYVMVGINDTGFEVARVTPEEEARGLDPESFPLRWRLPRLAVTVGQWLAGGPAYSRHRRRAHEEPEFVGLWHAGGFEIRIRRDGRIVLPGTEPLAWNLRQGRLFVWSDGLREEFDTHYTLEEGRLRLQLPGFPGGVVLERGPSPDPDPLLRGWRAAAAGRHEEAVRWFAEARPHRPLAAGRGLVAALAALGRHREAETVLDDLRRRLAAGEPGAIEAVVAALVALDRIEEAIDLVAREFDRSGEAPALFEVLFEVGARPGFARRLRNAFDAALAQDRLHGALRAQIQRYAALAWQVDDRDRALDLILRAELQAPHRPFTAWILRRLGAEREEVERRLQAIGAAASDRHRVLESFTRSRAEEDRAMATLAYHLERIVARARRHGATPVLLTYPFRHQAIEKTIRRVARAHRVEVLDLATHFEKLLESHAFHDLFAVDGHCNDRGYQVIAELVAEHALRSW